MNKNATGFIDNMNDIQKKTLEDFKTIVKTKIPNIDFSIYIDSYLLRFLRARKFNLENTFTMFNNFINWRKDFGTDEIESFDFNEGLLVKQYYPHGYHKTDKIGRPIYIEIIGDINVKELFNITSEERMMKYYVKEYERTIKYRFAACSKNAGKLIEQSLTILDMKGEAMKFMFGKTKDFVKIAAKIAQDYYPEMLGNMFIVNTPFTFKALWTIVKAFLDEKTAQKIKLEGSSYQKKLYEIVEKENLPEILGGTCKCSFIQGGCLYSDIGPWNPEGCQNWTYKN